MSQQQFQAEIMNELQQEQEAQLLKEDKKMDKSDSIKELAAALSKAQGMIEGAIKDSANPFFKSKYADLASVWAAIRKPLSVNGLSVTQFVEDAEHGIGVHTTLMHSSGEWVSGKFAMPVSKIDAQGIGSAITYARRYALAAVCGVAPEDDDGNAATKAAPKTIIPTSGAWEAMDEESQKWLQTIADAVHDWMKTDAVADAFAEIDAEKLDAEQKTALWTRLDSKERAAIKKYANSRIAPSEPQ